MSNTTRIGIIGGGLMGREVASALSRWFVLENFPVHAELTAVCDLAEKQREWFRRIPSVKLLTADYHELLASPYFDVVMQAFGPKRLLYGSDWPVCLAGVSYRDWLATVRAAVCGFSASEQEDIFSGNARRFYSLDRA